MPTKYQPTVHGKIAKLIADYETKINALRIAGALLNGHVEQGKAPRQHAVIADALALDAKRRGNGHSEQEPKQRGRPKGSKHDPGKPFSRNGMHAAAVKRRRLATYKFLYRVSQSEGPYIPKQKGSKGGISVLLQHGYLKKQGDGYVRTEKVFTL